MQGGLSFERWLDVARDTSRVPEARDYSAWRRERMGWFAQSAAQDEHGRSRTAPICASRPSPCLMAACC
jgi:hypothetical protein